MSAATTTHDYRALLAAQDWGSLGQSLKLFAWKATGSRSMERAEDLAQDVIARVWTDAGARWNPGTEPNLLRYLTGILRGDLSNERRLKRTSHEVLSGDEALEEHAGADATSTPDLLLVRRETNERVFAALRARVAGREIDGRVVSCFEAGIDRAAEQATETGEPIAEIRRARRRVFDHAAAIARELGDESEVT